MTRFELFESVKLTEAIALTDGGTAPPGTLGAVVEVFKEGEAYIISCSTPKLRKIAIR
jgi:hypothetical protein